MIVRKNKKTGEVVSAEDLGAFYYTKDWEEGTQEDYEQEIFKKAKAEKLKEVDTLKKEKLYKPLEYKNFTLNAGEKAQNNILGRLLSIEEKKEWLDIYGNNIEFTKIEFQEIRDLLDDRTLFVYKNEAMLIKQIQEAKTQEELDNIDVKATFDTSFEPINLTIDEDFIEM